MADMTNYEKMKNMSVTEMTAFITKLAFPLVNCVKENTMQVAHTKIALTFINNGLKVRLNNG